MKIRLLATIVALVVATAGHALAQPTPAVPLEISVIDSMTGPGAYLGKSEVEALHLAEGYVNKTGGIRGRPIKFVVADDQTNPVLAVQLMNQAIGRKASVVIGPTLTSTCAAIVPIVKTGPVNYCMSPGIEAPKGSYVFSASDSSNDQAIVVMRYFRQKNWKRVALITSTDATGQVLNAAFAAAAAMPENATMKLVSVEHFNPTDISVTAQIANMKAASPQAIIAWSTGTQFGTLLHGISDAGLNLPVAAGTGNMSNDQLSQYVSFMPSVLLFPGLQSLVEGGDVPPAVRAAQTVYFNTFRAAGITPGFLHNLAWDPAMLIVAALRANGPDATPEQIRSFIAGQRRWAGINGIYDFVERPQRGVGPAATVIDQWDASKGTFTVVTKPAGYL